MPSLPHTQSNTAKLQTPCTGDGKCIATLSVPVHPLLNNKPILKLCVILLPRPCFSPRGPHKEVIHSQKKAPQFGH